ncbi:uncharacterized protein LOC108950035 isoform X1 [Ciona intestinalis]
MLRALAFLILLHFCKETCLGFRILFSSQSFKSNDTFQNLCDTKCVCGQYSHPGQDNFDIQYGKFDANFSPVPISSYISGDLVLGYPVYGMLCVGHTLKRFPQDPGTNASFNQFLLKMSVLVLRQGNIASLRHSDVMLLRHHLEYLDLSRNRIEFIEGDTFNKFNALQVVDLRFNKLTTLGGSEPIPTMPFPSTGNDIEFTGTGNMSLSRPTFKLKGNPLVCTCKLVTTIHSYVTMSCDDGVGCFEIDAENRRQFIPIGPCLLDKVIENLCTTKLETTQDNPDHIEDPLTQYGGSQHDYQHKDASDRDLRGMTGEEKHLSMDYRLNITPPDDTDHDHRVVKKEVRVDIPLFLTMSVWFMMVYFGIIRFIRSNEMDHDSPIPMPKPTPKSYTQLNNIG